MDSERDGDVLTVHEEIEEDVRVGDEDRLRPGGRVSAQAADQLGAGAVTVADGNVATGGPQVPTGPHERLGHRPGAGLSGGGHQQVCRHVLHRPLGAQRAGLPLLVVEALQEVGQGQPFGADQVPGRGIHAVQRVEARCGRALAKEARVGRQHLGCGLRVVAAEQEQIA